MFLSSRSAPPCVRGASRHSEEQQYYYNDKYNIIASICVKKTESVIASRSQQQAGANGRARGAARLPPPPPLTSHGAGRDAPGHRNGRLGRPTRRDGEGVMPWKLLTPAKFGGRFTNRNELCARIETRDCRRIGTSCSRSSESSIDEQAGFGPSAHPQRCADRRSKAATLRPLSNVSCSTQNKETGVKTT